MPTLNTYDHQQARVGEHMQQCLDLLYLVPEPHHLVFRRAKLLLHIVLSHAEDEAVRRKMMLAVGEPGLPFVAVQAQVGDHKQCNAGEIIGTAVR